MALKAGRVGVDPSQVDMAGKVIGGSDSYTKAQADAKFATKTSLNEVGSLALRLESNLTTITHDTFKFEFDPVSEKYGYVVGDVFHPFEEGGSGGIGWVTPPDLTSEGITVTRCTILNGGYYDDGEFIYIDILVQRSNTNTASLDGFPAATGNANILVAKDIVSSEFTKYVANGYFTTSSGQTSTSISLGGGSADGVYHIWGQYYKKVV